MRSEIKMNLFLCRLKLVLGDGPPGGCPGLLFWNRRRTKKTAMRKRMTNMELTTAAMMAPVLAPSSGSGTVPVTTWIDDLVNTLNYLPAIIFIIKKIDDFVIYMYMDLFPRDHSLIKKIVDFVKYIELFTRDHFYNKTDWGLCKIHIRFIYQGPFLNKEDWWLHKIHWLLYHLFIRRSIL